MSNTQKKNVPELRFPGFEGEWEEKQLGDLTDRVIRKNKNLESKKPLTISGQLGLIDQTEYFSKSVSSKNLENYTLIKNGEFGYPLGAIKRLTRYDSGVLSSLYICFSIKSEMSKDFMEAYFDSTHWYREVSGIAVEGARNHGLLNVSVNDFFTILIKYPSLEEQQKIGKFFSKLDRQIELEEQKLELLQQQKKGYMQKIFSQELRFKDENGEDYPDWENSKIEKYLKERNERSDKGQMLSVTINSGIIKFSELDRKDNSSKDKSNYKVVRKNDIAYNSMRMWQGASGKSNYNGIVSPAYTVLYPTQNTSSLFIGYKFKTHRMIHKFKINSQGLTSDTWNLKYKQLKNINIDIPVLEEQEKIGDFFKKMDILISKQKMKIEILEKEKQSFLQKMFL
ncbi:restriction endonuclease subunit S [Staphylococcus aureus]|uniref:restriction endonuclease subunit S n=1 Tax=Staphylococcus aureus TaxID=1280 RepID=UPI0004535C6C|nr:restriction endonuclease subunit S [Staphylococcus aureus]EUQ60779.1 type I restriction-modification enzyme, S subunit [Staphylococcus aureus WAMC6003]EUQ77957.1 type I restriction-modification enzyme, S subunit [Staphylococcus aureus SMMC6030]EVV09290.1 type I restriction-modification enzyme, S subunit [Staphylococcus aureus M41648]EVV15192.1 type I restriction-modification enzyme, S subunit [Staphylococcus aureus F54452]EVW35816.1 type I restriction-modification enzyme, S subunit [Staphyl